MSAHDTKSHILITTEIEEELHRIENELKPNRVVKFFEDEFKIENAKEVVAESYISESEIKYLVLAAKSFNTISQNALLKVLEEPPRNIRFIIITPSKSNLLPTVRSRLPLVKGVKNHTDFDIDLNLSRIDYEKVFAFLKEHARIGKVDAKVLIERIYYRATVIDMLILTQQQLDNFDKSYRLLELNTRPQNVLAMLLMSFMSKD